MWNLKNNYACRKIGTGICFRCKASARGEHQFLVVCSENIVLYIYIYIRIGSLDTSLTCFCLRLFGAPLSPRNGKVLTFCKLFEHPSAEYWWILYSCLDPRLVTQQFLDLFPRQMTFRICLHNFDDWGCCENAGTDTFAPFPSCSAGCPAWWSFAWCMYFILGYYIFSTQRVWCCCMSMDGLVPQECRSKTCLKFWPSVFEGGAVCRESGLASGSQICLIYMCVYIPGCFKLMLF